jgi:hypothetical protein
MTVNIHWEFSLDIEIRPKCKLLNNSYLHKLSKYNIHLVH